MVQSVNFEQKKEIMKQSVALLGRQSIYDHELGIFAYEVLYRPIADCNGASDIVDGSQATPEAMLNTFIEVGLNSLAGNKRVFINMAESFIDGEIEIPWPPESIVIDVPGNVKPTPKVLQGLQSLKYKGYLISLDGFLFDEEGMNFVPLVDIIKIDLTQTSKKALKANLKTLRSLTDVKLLAKKVETQKDYRFCHELGFDYFQGHFLEKPVIVKGSTIPPNKIATLQLVNRLQVPSIEIEELEELIKIDVSLSYKILKYINSPGFHLGGEVTSINQALMLLGIKNLKNWMSLIVLSGLSDKPPDVTRKTLIRAKMCEEIAQVIKAENKEDYFLVGMFSLLDVMLSQEMKSVLSTIPIKQALKDALLNYKNKEGKVLKLVVDYERGAWHEMKSGTITASSLRTAYLTSIAWADEAMSGLAAS